MSKAINYEAAAQKLQNMSQLNCISDDFKTALKMGARALEVMYSIEQLNEIIPEAES